MKKQPTAPFTLAGIAPTTHAQLPHVAESILRKPISERTVFKVIPLGYCRIVLVNDAGGAVTRYQDLPTFQLNEAEKKLVTEIAKGLEYDGNHILITNLTFDGNNLRVSAVSAKYSILRALAKGIIKRDSLYFKTGAMTPTNPSFLLQRKDTFWSPTGGFAEPGEHGSLTASLGENMFDLFRLTALKEASEELLLQTDLSQQPKFVKLGGATISIRYTHGSRVPTIEFFIPLNLDLKPAAVARIIKNNTAPDKAEHLTGKLVDLTTGPKLKEFLRNVASYPGAFLFAPTLFATMPGLKGAYDTHKESLFKPAGGGGGKREPSATPTQTS